MWTQLFLMVTFPSGTSPMYCQIRLVSMTFMGKDKGSRALYLQFCSVFVFVEKKTIYFSRFAGVALSLLCGEVSTKVAFFKSTQKKCIFDASIFLEHQVHRFPNLLSVPSLMGLTGKK